MWHDYSNDRTHFSLNTFSQVLNLEHSSSAIIAGKSPRDIHLIVGLTKPIFAGEVETRLKPNWPVVTMGIILSKKKKNSQQSFEVYELTDKVWLGLWTKINVRLSRYHLQ